MKITLGFSPCPNDTYIFEALFNRKVDWRGFDFEFVIEDVEYLNKRAIKNDIDVTKLSYFTFAKLIGTYQMFRSGGALGYNCGPLLVSDQDFTPLNLAGKSCAIPGLNTTANLLCSVIHPEIIIKHELLFSEIEDAVLNKKIDLGLIIHESRFTYEKKGLIKISDLGEAWQHMTGSPIPLGGIAVRRNLDEGMKKELSAILRESVEYAFEHGDNRSFIKSYSQEMEDDVIDAHIGLYVNAFTRDVGPTGEKGVERFMEELIRRDIISNYSESLFVG